MNFDYYAGKTAVITGAASGMGLLTSKALAAAGNMAGAQKQQLQTLIASIDDELTKDRL